MKSAAIAIVVFSCLVCIAVATQVSQCEGKDYPDLEKVITVGTCNKPPCKLRKKTTIVVDIKFTPEHEIKTLRTNVYAEVLGLPLPFVGVDGISACDKIFLADGETPAPCPLQPGTEYKYRNTFPIHEFYPRVSVLVHWSLTEKDDKELICFQVPARIF